MLAGDRSLCPPQILCLFATGVYTRLYTDLYEFFWRLRMRDKYVDHGLEVGARRVLFDAAQEFAQLHVAPADDDDSLYIKWANT